MIRLSSMLLALGLASAASANECLDLLPYDTVAEGLPSVCQSGFTGIRKNYSCQDYRSGKTLYRVLYRGGTSPKAIIRISADNTQSLLVSPLQSGRKLSCPLAPPSGIPQHAVHRGIGVCQDAQDHDVACSVFEHAPARQTDVHRYMTFYTEDKTPSVQIDDQIVGTNHDAITAEMAYQIGMSLWETDCCAGRAVEYLALAYRLFPRAEAYRKAYRHSRVSLALKEMQ